MQPGLKLLLAMRCSVCKQLILDELTDDAIIAYIESWETGKRLNCVCCGQSIKGMEDNPAFLERVEAFIRRHIDGRSHPTGSQG